MTNNQKQSPKLGRSSALRIIGRRLLALILWSLRKLPEIRHLLYSIGLLAVLVLIIAVYLPHSSTVDTIMVERFKFPSYWERVVLFALLGVVARRLRYRNRLKKNNWGLVMSDILTDLFLVPVTTLMIVSLASIIRFDIGMRSDVSLQDANPMILNGVAFMLGGYSSYQLHMVLSQFRNNRSSSRKRSTKTQKSATQSSNNV